MNDEQQNNHYEMLTGLALKGGHFPWSKVPISDGDPESGSFETSRPLAGMRREAAKVSPRLTALGSAEPHVATREYEESAPRNPYAGPARVMPWTPGRHLNEQFKPRTDKGPLAGLSTNQFADAMLDLFDSIDKRRRQRDKRALHGPNRVPIKQQQDDDGEVEAHGQTRVANDRRQVAFDVEVLMPLDEENLYNWHSWLPKKLSISKAAHPYWSSLRSFLQREGLQKKKFRELDWKEKVVLERLVEKMVGAAA